MGQVRGKAPTEDQSYDYFLANRNSSNLRCSGRCIWNIDRMVILSENLGKKVRDSKSHFDCLELKLDICCGTVVRL